MRNLLDFLQPHRADDEVFSLSSGERILIQKYFLTFHQWTGAPPPYTYGNKAVLDWNGEPVFAELAVLRLFQSHGWDGVWIDSYGGKFRTGLPQVVDPVPLPEPQTVLLKLIEARTGRSGGCWDVFLWKANSVVFVEVKRRQKDKIQINQIRWLEKARMCGIEASQFAILEWDVSGT